MLIGVLMRRRLILVGVFDEVDRRFDEVKADADRRFDEAKADTGRRFDQIEERISQLEKVVREELQSQSERLHSQNIGLANLRSDVVAELVQIKTLLLWERHTLDSHEEKINHLETRLEDCCQRIAAIEVIIPSDDLLVVIRGTLAEEMKIKHNKDVSKMGYAC